jgi:DNA/RNA endonuclease YhcR with UshA esterase domain
MFVNRLLATSCWLLLLFVPPAFADCHPFSSAPEHLGETTCIRGKVVKLVIGPTGLHFLNFCDDYRTCPFTVVIFPRDLRDVGDVRTLEGKEIQITGKVKNYKGQLEIILRDRGQLRGDTASLPNLPKNYDVARKGSYSAGTFSSPTSSTSQKTNKKGRREPSFPEDE